MKALTIILPCLIIASHSCKRGSGHAKPGENTPLLKIESEEDQLDQDLANTPLIPSPLDPEPLPEIPDPVIKPNDSAPIVAKPNRLPPDKVIIVPPDTTEPGGIVPVPDHLIPEGEATFPSLCVANIPKSSLPDADYNNGSKRVADVKARATEHVRKALNEKGLHLGDPIFIRIIKEENVAELFIQERTTKKYKLAHSYTIAAMSGKLGPKKLRGDFQAPEGFYYVPMRQMNPQSTFHLSFNIGYPNTYDTEHGYTGDFIMMHGNEVSAGCYAMTDPVMEEIYTICDAALSSEKQRFFRFHSFPFRMTEENMQKHSENPNLEFWKNLKEGYDYFEKNKIPPSVSVRNKKYVFDSP